MKQWMPWYAKLAAKLVLARLPFKYNTWRRLNVFVHGSMDKPDYAYRIFQEHFHRSEFARKSSPNGFVALEIGPGDSLLSAIVAKSYGASAVYLIDSGAYATDDLQPYRAFADYLRSLNRPAPELGGISNLPGLLAACDATYGTEGLKSIRHIPGGSVDFIWSQAVLEHIRRDEFLELVVEMRRVLRSDGVCSHRIDLKDHLGGALNNLRIPSRLWEADWMARSGFYTNRIRYKQMLELFREGGFDVQVLRTETWNRLPTRRERFASEYRQHDEGDLLVSGFDVVLRPKRTNVIEASTSPAGPLRANE
jgi:SAM-dependent methyltransferase